MSRKRAVTLIIILSLILSGLLFINYNMTRPTKLNKIIASKYNAPANSAFTDQNFYNCVVDSYNSYADYHDIKKISYTTKLSDDQLKNFYDLACISKKIKSIKGIEKLTNLRYLDVKDNQITSLDVSKNTNLTYLKVYDNQITNLDVSKNIKLETLDVTDNKITNLDVSKNIKLEKLNVTGNKITSLDVSKNIKLETLDVGNISMTNGDATEGNNKITNLDVSKNTNLTYLNAFCSGITSLDVSKNINLTYLYVSCNKITSLDVSKNLNLTSLDVSYTKITSLDVSKNIKLETLDVNDNKITSLDVSKNLNLTDLFAGRSQLTSLDVSKNVKLTQLDVSDNQLTNLKLPSISGNKLEKLYVSNNKLTSLDVSKNPNLTYLNVEFNQLTNLDLRYNSKLIDIYVGFNTLKNVILRNIKSLDSATLTDIVDYNPNLQSLTLGNNDKLTSISINNSNLQKIYFEDQKNLKTVTLSNNPKLYRVSLDKAKSINKLVLNNNGITTDGITGLSELKELQYLNLNNNSLTSLNISALTKLQTLYVDNQKDSNNNKTLKTAILPNSNSLITLSVKNNALSELDLSKYTNLKNLYTRSSTIQKLDLRYNRNLETMDISSQELNDLILRNVKSITSEKLKSIIEGALNLQVLTLQNNDNLTDISISNSNLQKIYFEDQKNLKTVTLSNNPKLYRVSLDKAKSINKLVLNNNGITTDGITGLNVLTDLQYLNLSNNSLASLDLYNLKKLVNLEAANQKDSKGNKILTKLILPSSSKLQKLVLNDNILSKISNLNKLTELQYLNLNNNILTSLNVSALTKLQTLYVDNQKDSNNNKTLKTAILPNSNSLITLSVKNNALSELDLSKYTNLKNLYTRSSTIQKLDLRYNRNLETMDISSQELNDLILRNVKSITSEKLKSIIEGALNLQVLTLQNNDNLTDISISNSNLQKIYFEDQKNLKTVTLSNNPKLYRVSLDKAKSINKLVLNNNGITTDGITGLNVLTDLQYLNLSNNSLVSLDLSNLTNLVTLEVSNQKNKNNEKVFTSIKLPTNTNNKLQVLDVSNNNLTSIDLSKSTSLKKLSLCDNQYNLGTISTVLGNKINGTKLITSDNIKLNSNMTKKFKAAYLNDVLQSVDENNNITMLKTGTNNYKIEFIVSLNGKEETITGTYTINVKDINLLSDKYKINNEKGYIYTGLDTDSKTILSNLKIDVEEGTTEIKDNKVLIKNNDKVLREYKIINITKTDYDLSKDYIYTKITDFDISKITTNCELTNVNNTLEIGYDGEVFNIYKIVNIKSDYKIYGKWIYIVGEFDINKIIPINATLTDNKGILEVKYNNEVIDSLTELKIDFGSLKVTKDKILPGEIKEYTEFMKNIKSDNLGVKLYKGTTLITKGNIEEGMTLKVISSEYGEIMTYTITKEYVDVSKLEIDEKNYIKKYNVGTTYEEIRKEIDTSGSVKFIDNTGKELENSDIIRTGSKVVIELSTETKEYTIVVYGDINGDGKITMSDLVKSANYLIDETIISEDCYKEAIDVTKDGKVRMSDIIKLSNILIGSN